jgi:hypothetical protein
MSEMWPPPRLAETAVNHPTRFIQPSVASVRHYSLESPVLGSELAALDFRYGSKSEARLYPRESLLFGRFLFSICWRQRRIDLFLAPVPTFR